MGAAPSRTGRATLATIAATAGVSVATVSKVLNGRSDVSPSTRARVQDLLLQFEYPAATPRRTADAETQPTIELSFNGALGGYAAEIIEGAIAAGTTERVGITISQLEGPVPETATAWARRLSSAGRKAVIAVSSVLAPGHVTALGRARLPLVVIDPLNQPGDHITSIGATNFAGGLAATQHLLSLGHRRIAYLGGMPSADCNRARLHGYRAALEAEGVHAPTTYVRHGRFHFEDGIVAGSAFLELAEPPTAVFAASDEMALGVIEAARTHGLRVPQDLSVVGFDDTGPARMASPPLTTVRQPLREMARVAVKTALQLAAGEPVDSHHVELATHLVVRESTAPPALLAPGRQRSRSAG